MFRERTWSADSDTGGKPHGEHHQEVEELLPGPSALGKGIGTENGENPAVDGSVDGDKESVGVGDPEPFVGKDGSKGVPLKSDGEGDDLAGDDCLSCGDGGREDEEERIEAKEGKEGNEEIGNDFENQFRR